LGRVGYEEAHVLQRALQSRGAEEHLLLLEHPHVFTLGVHADASHVLVHPASVGAQLVRTDRGGDVTYHGPGQLVGYPILDVAMGPGAIPAHVERIEQVVIDSLAVLGLRAGRLRGFPGVWVDAQGPDPRKICAIGARVTKGRSMHGFALNVNPDLEWFDRIVPCGILDKAVTSIAAEGLRVSMQEALDALVGCAQRVFARGGPTERQDVVSFVRGARSAAVSAPGERLRLRLRQSGVEPDEGIALSSRKPPWLRVKAHMGDEFLGLRRTVTDLGLVTVCEEAGCPNIFECWAEGTATFMINGERCTRACGFCLVDTRHPLPLDPDEPSRVAEAVDRLGLEHAVITAVARDDLADGGAGGFAATVAAIRDRAPGTQVEVLVSDCKGHSEAVSLIIEARPDVFNHNLETVARLQRAVRPSAGYARSLAVLARAKDARLVTKSGLILGMGETEQEVVGALADLRGVGVDIVTLGQYLRPSSAHLPVARWWTPEEFDRLREIGDAMGFAHVQSSPLTRSSYHARDASAAASGFDAVRVPVANSVR
jgi:lipoic acid synthetase